MAGNVYLCLKRGSKRGFDWVWLGVWERNFKDQNFTNNSDLNGLASTTLSGEAVDTDWLLASI